jgi:hypothetical protein
MASHVEQMAARLPLLYREGELLTGLLSLVAVQIAIAEEDGRAVQRSHWFDDTLDLDEAVRLAAPLGIPREEWQFNRRHLSMSRVTPGRHAIDVLAGTERAPMRGPIGTISVGTH